MKSIKQIPISHPTWQMIQSKLDETHDDLCRVSFCINMLGWGKESNTNPMKISIPVSTRLDTSWQMITYEVFTVNDYKTLADKYDELRQKVYQMSQKGGGK